MEQLQLALADLAAVGVLVLAVFVPRFRRRDMMVGLLTLNFGVLSISMLLSSTEVNAGLGLGLFGLLSIVRLRSDELTHEEMAFYFAALILGLLGGIETTPIWRPIAMMTGLVLIMYIGGHPRLLSDMHSRNLTLDSAMVNEADIRNRLHGLVDGEIHNIRIRSVDLVNDSTQVVIRYSEPTPIRGRGASSETDIDLNSFSATEPHSSDK